MKLLLKFTIVLISLSLYAQITETPPPSYIRTIQFKVDSDMSQLPLIRLGQRFELSFDDLVADESDYFYTIEHFNFDWTPSGLAKSEYLDGFDEVRISKQQNSFNSLVAYTHYTLTLPNNEIRRITKSGNYLISIFDRDNELVFSRKFMVYEPLANVGVSIKRARDHKYINEKQVVHFTINSSQVNLINPNENVKTWVIKNNNLNKSITHLKPQFTLGNELIYRYDVEASFWGGNEFFNFDNSDIRAITSSIQYTTLDETFHNFLYTNLARKNRNYTYFPDINGNFRIRNRFANNSNTESEYAWVYFSLKYDEPIEAGSEIHLYGAFNNYTLDHTTVMDYDAEKNVYTNRYLLKQGFYNYDFVIVDNQGSIDRGAISGNFYQTENDYTVLVYYRPVGGLYDRLIGVGHNNSTNITN